MSSAETIAAAAEIVAAARLLPEVGDWQGTEIERAKWHAFLGYLENAEMADSAEWVATMTPAALHVAAVDYANDTYKFELDQ